MAKEIKQENEAVVSAVSKTEQFFEENGKLITIIFVALIVLTGGIYAYYKYAYQPQQAEAQAQMVKAENLFKEQVFQAQNAFEQGNWEVALNGDGNNLGFKQIIDEYGSKPGKSVYMYAAICEIQREGGDLDAALDYLNSYSGDDIMQARAESLKGDVYCNKEDYKTALSYYVKAAGVAENVFNAAYLLKAAQCCEALGENDKALEYYKTIKDVYSTSVEARDIEKYITRLEIKK